MIWSLKRGSAPPPPAPITKGCGYGPRNVMYSQIRSKIRKRTQDKNVVIFTANYFRRSKQMKISRILKQIFCSCGQIRAKIRTPKICRPWTIRGPPVGKDKPIRCGWKITVRITAREPYNWVICCVNPINEPHWYIQLPSGASCPVYTDWPSG
jgi:hypothetical protein